MKRTPPTPNSGGFIQRAGGPKTYIPPDPGYKGPLSDGSAGTGPGPDTHQAWRTGDARPPATPAAAPVAGAPTPSPVNRPAQTERANPLVNGGGAPQPEGTSVPVPAPTGTLDPAKALGFSQRGNRTPAGSDLNLAAPSSASAPAGSAGFLPGDPNAPGGQLAPQPGDEEASPVSDLKESADSVQNDLKPGHIGGTGAHARKFTNPTSAGIYSQYAKALFGNNPSTSPQTSLTRARGTPRYDSNDNFDAGA